MPNRKPLLDDNDQFLPEVQKALLEIFDKFDLDKDGKLNNAELDAFAVASNGEPFDDASLNDLFANFDNDKGKLTKDGFLDMFHLQTLSDEDETYKDLEKHGYSF
ncbi:hypothetical protein HK097_011313 [Rhizophlyctis rosea]|uniref:EF-hand domain-containing protein n=1 Tax=Rhizophlyctis rosea TaxID=64517 RepID=A0AAD5SIG7_9FUNG|nr:hypothetical protein HK097_011313 [Rhizophlyctis rosea]